MKAIIHMFRGGTGDQSQATYDRLRYLLKPTKNRGDNGDRVVWVGGELDGYGVVSYDATQMANALDSGHDHLRGRLTRHLIISCEPCSEEIRDDAEERLIKSAPLVAAALGARRWIAVIHNDTAKPHLHMILSNYDEKLERRFDFRPTFLSELEEMNWTPHFKSGKGAKVRDDRSYRGQKIHDLRMEGVRRRMKEKKAAMEKLRMFLKQKNALALDDKDLFAWLLKFRDSIPSGWSVSKMLRKSGKPRTHPLILIDGCGIRITNFVRSVKSETKKKLDLEKKQN